jgi:hypothetical protein
VATPPEPEPELVDEPPELELLALFEFVLELLELLEPQAASARPTTSVPTIAISARALDRPFVRRSSPVFRVIFFLLLVL